MKHKSTTRLFTLLLVLTLILTLLPTSALADADICGDFEYLVNGESSCAVTGYLGSSLDVTIPDKLDGYTVTEIGMNAFKDDGLTSVVIPDTVQMIGSNAFYGNKLSSVTLSSSVWLIGVNAFGENTVDSVTMTEFTLPEPEEGYISRWSDTDSNVYSGGDSVTVSGQYERTYYRPFFDYYFIDEYLKIICIYQYNGPDGDVVIPETIDGYIVHEIAYSAFSDKGITSVTLPSSVMRIHENAFANNSGLASITLPASYKGYVNTYIDGSGNEYAAGSQITDFTKEYKAKVGFVETPEGKAVITHFTPDSRVCVIPSKISNLTVWGIYEEACVSEGITKLTLPNTITHVGEAAFADNELTSVTLPSSIKLVARYAFEANEDLESFNLPEAPQGYTSYWNEYERDGGDVCSVESESEEMAPATTRPPVIINEVNGGYTVTNFSNAYEWVRNEPNKYTVTFKDLDGTVIKTVTQDYGTAIEYPQLAEKEGYTAGWDSELETVPAENITITAAYTVNQYTVTFKDSDGTVMKTAKVDFGTAIDYPADPTREGYIFDGWDSDLKTMPAENITITASYISAEAPRGNITGTLLDSDGNPIAGKTVKLHSKVVTTVTDSKGRFTFTNVPLVDHELIIESSEGTELGRYDLSFGKSDSTSYSVDDTDVDVNVTSNTVAIDILVNVSNSGEVSIEKITFGENPQTGDTETASTWIVWVILAVFVVAVALVIWRNSAEQK